MVFSAIQRQSKVKTKVIEYTNIENVSAAITEFVSEGSIKVSDEHHA